MRLLLLLILICCTSCSKYKPKPFYEIACGEEILFQLTAFKDEPYYWEWKNKEAVTTVNLETRVYSEAFIYHKMQKDGLETWTLKGLKPGTDTLRLHLRTYEEDSLNVPVADSLIMIVKVN